MKAKSLSYEKQQKEKPDGIENTNSKTVSVPIRNQESTTSRPPRSLQGSLNDALVQLQKGNSLQRRASKRFSAYQYAKLTNHSPNNNLARIVSTESYKIPEEPTLKSDVNETLNSSDFQESGTTHIFLRINNRTKKVNIRLPVTFAALRLLLLKNLPIHQVLHPFLKFICKIHKLESLMSWKNIC